MKNVLTNGFYEISQDEMFMINGGDAARARMKEEIRKSGVKCSEEGKKAAVSYTLGYLSLATCWCSPLSFGFGAIGTLYSCM